MISTEIEWVKLLTIVNSLAGPVITAVAVVASVLFYRADRGIPTLFLLIGCILIFVQRVAHAIAWLPGIGYFDRGAHVHGSQILAFNNFTVLLNLFAWLLFVGGLLMVAMGRFRASRAAAPMAVGAS